MSAKNVIIARCADSSLFVGLTNDPVAAIEAINAGQGTPFTKSRLPVSLALVEEFMNEEDALERARDLKKMTRLAKEKLIAAALAVNLREKEPAGLWAGLGRWLKS